MKNRVYFQLACWFLLLPLLAGCRVRDVPDDYPAGVIRMKLDWEGLTEHLPQGKWLVFYPENGTMKPFSQEVGDDIFIDTLPQGRYKALLLAMNKDISRLDFIGMQQIEQATVSLKELQEELGLYPDAERVYSEAFAFDLTQPVPGVVILKPKPLALQTTFEIQIPGAKQVQACLKGIPTEMNLWTRKAVYLDQEHYTPLLVKHTGDNINLSGMVLMPTKAAVLTKTENAEIILQLEVNVTYDSGEQEEVKVDVTQALNDVAVEAPPEVKFELKKVGLTATVVGWEPGTGSGEVIIK